LVLAVAGCGGSKPAPNQVVTTQTMQLKSPAFAAGARIPSAYTCQGRDISPPLRWSNVPAGTRGLALEMVDIDAPGGTFVHWALIGISPSIKGLAAGESVPPDAVAGRSSFGSVGYRGPCPPAGKPHRYVITLLALPARSGLRPGFSIGALQSLHALARGQLTGLYGR
jgi:Raf kinase inhibitor-like YbhB/YbcL family protein